jgi:hypothetical protein
MSDRPPAFQAHPCPACGGGCIKALISATAVYEQVVEVSISGVAAGELIKCDEDLHTDEACSVCLTCGHQW